MLVQLDKIEDPKIEITDDIRDLEKSILEQGLLNPITVQVLNDSEYRIIAGKKRYVAAKLAGLKEIEVTIRLIQNDDESNVINLHENLQRTNLDIWTRAAMVKKFHELKKRIHGGKEAHRPRKEDKGKGWGMRETAAELGIALGAVSEDVLLAEAVEADPRLRAITDRRTAIKMVRSKTKQIEAELLAAAPSDFEINALYCGPSSQILAGFPDGSFDACITDPPWVRFKDKDYVRDPETMPTFEQIYRVLKGDSFLYIFVGWDDYSAYLEFLPRYGFACAKTPVIWHKKGVLTRGTKNWEYARDHEFILLAVKGNPTLTGSSQRSSVLSFDVVPSQSMVHPNEKPVPLIEKLIEDCTYPNAVMLDPFMGSGSHIEAAIKRNRRYIGIERNQEIFEKTQKRVQQATKEKEALQRLS